MKRCKVCGEVKPLDDFYRCAGMKDGHRHDCKVCNLAAKKARYDADPQKAITRVVTWQKANADHVRAVRRAHNATPERQRKQRDSYYLRTYGLTADQFDALLEQQGGGCAICRKLFERLASMHLDHDHRTGRIRGILCLNCNQGVGKFFDDPELLERAAAYLRAG